MHWAWDPSGLNKKVEGDGRFYKDWSRLSSVKLSGQRRSIFLNMVRISNCFLLILWDLYPNMFIRLEWLKFLQGQAGSDRIP